MSAISPKIGNLLCGCFISNPIDGGPLRQVSLHPIQRREMLASVWRPRTMRRVWCCTTCESCADQDLRRGRLSKEVRILVVSAICFHIDGGAHGTTVGTVQTTPLMFLDRTLRPLIRLPSLEEVGKCAPNNFVKQGYDRRVLALATSELDIWSWRIDWN